MEQFSFSINNSVAKSGIRSILQKLYSQKMPVIVCIGTDGVAGDSLGPFVGTILKQRNIPAFIYGHLDSPITAFEVPHLNPFLKRTHPDSTVLVIDSAVGKEEDIGVIKISDSALKPGLGAHKNLPEIGNVSIMGIVGKKGKSSVENLKQTRLRLIWQMANIIADGICEYLDYISQNSSINSLSLTKISKLINKAKAV